MDYPKIYNAIQMIKDLKEELHNLIPNIYITDEKLSEFLGQPKSHITKKKSQVKKNPSYKIALDLLETYELSLMEHFRENLGNLILIIQRYRDSNKLPISIFSVLKYHPNLKLDYFKNIDNKEKAYWLGFLYADGYLTKTNSLTFVVEISQKDEKLIDYLANAIGFNLKYKKYIDRNNTVRIRFKSETFATHLINYGFIVGKKKSMNIELPKLNNRKLYLAFLLGYFDGDGKQGTTSIKSGSKVFLEQIKTMFSLRYKISTIRYKIKTGEEREAYDFWLGAELFNEMLDNYENSLSRKRVRFEIYDDSLRMQVMSFHSIIKRLLKKEHITTNEGIKISKDQIHKYAWQFGKKHKFSYKLICDLCDKYNLQKPTKEYWIGTKFHKL